MKNLLTVFTLSALLVGCGQKEQVATQIVNGDQFADTNYVYRPGVDTGFSKYLTRSLYGTKKIVLTFDDGPHPVNTPKILDLLDRYNVKATFFVLGALAKKYPEIIERMNREGHIVANHSYDHANSNDVSKADFEKSVVDSIKNITSSGWEGREQYFRFPYGAYGSKRRDYHHYESLKSIGQKLYGENCLNFVFWDVDTSDWYLKKYSKAPQMISQTAYAHLEGGLSYDFDYYEANRKPQLIRKGLQGGVILMHDIHETSFRALPLLLDKVLAQGYEVVPLNEVEEFQYPAKLECQLKNLF